MNARTSKKETPVKPSFDWIRIICFVAGICNFFILLYLGGELGPKIKESIQNFFIETIIFGVFLVIAICIFFTHVYFYVYVYRYHKTKKIYLIFHNILKWNNSHHLGEALDDLLHSWAEKMFETYFVGENPYSFNGSRDPFRNYDKINSSTLCDIRYIIEFYSDDMAAPIIIYLQLESLLHKISTDFFIWETKEGINPNNINEDNVILSDTGYYLVCYMISILDDELNWRATLFGKPLNPNFYQSQKQFLENIKKTREYPKDPPHSLSLLLLGCYSMESFFADK